MEEKERTALSNTADAITEKATTIEVDILHPTWLQKLRKQTRKTFELKPATLGTLVKISKEMLSIEVEEADKGNFMLLAQKLMAAHSSRLARIIALAIANSKEDPPQSLIDFIQYNMSAEKMAIVAAHVLQKMDITSFVSSIISIKGTNILEMSLNNQRS
jgi:hypothetical protein